MTKKECLKKIKIGRWVRYMWDDVGAEDGIVIEINNLKWQFSKIKQIHTLQYRVFSPHSNITQFIDYTQIISYGSYIQANKAITGL